MNIEQYAEGEKRLKDFLDEPFGGSIGKSEDGYRQAINECMSHYAQERGQEINMQKVLASVDREMDSEKKAPEVGIDR